MKTCKLTPARKKQLDKRADAEEFQGLSAPTKRALVGAGYRTLAQVAKVKESEVSALHGLGPNGLKILKAKLTQKGLKLEGLDAPAGRC